MSEANPHLLVVFGALGDLARRKLIPAIYRLSMRSALGQRFVLLGVDTDQALDDSSYREKIVEMATIAGGDYGHWCQSCIHYQPLRRGEAGYRELAERIAALNRVRELRQNRVYYLAIPTHAVTEVAGSLASVGLNEGPGRARLVLEKPFGYDLVSSRRLNAELHRHFDESQIFRVDHFLGKETVQNLMALRFANTLFEHLWSREHVQSVEITAAESLGVERRAQYYERAGVIRDMVQNHLTQVLSLVAMEPPSSLDEQSIRQAKLQVLEQVKPVQADAVVFGQYVRGEIDGQQVRGYVDEDGVAPGSRTPTFVALRLEVVNPRWRGVPFYISSGKRLSSRHTHIALRYHRTAASVFHPNESSYDLRPNLLLITLQPDEGFDLQFQVKIPGVGYALSTERLRFRYSDSFGPTADAYETLLSDVVAGDRTHFVCDTEVEAAWRIYEPVLGATSTMYSYTAGSRGPVEADSLGAEWIDHASFHP